jgi:hypothetical protein
MDIRMKEARMPGKTDPIAPPPKPRKPGRPAKLDEKAKNQIVAMVAVGCSRARAARLAGVRPTALTMLVKRDRAFADEINQAEKRRETEALASIQRASGKSWRAAAWLLERTMRRQYGRPSAAKTQKRANKSSPMKGALDALMFRMADERTGRRPLNGNP